MNKYTNLYLYNIYLKNKINKQSNIINYQTQIIDNNYTKINDLESICDNNQKHILYLTKQLTDIDNKILNIQNEHFKYNNSFNILLSNVKK